MRTIGTTLATLVLLSTGCAPLQPDHEAADHVELVGTFARTDDGSFVGAEYLRLFDGAAELVCQRGWSLDAFAVDADDDTTLEVLRDPLRALADDCDIEADHVTVGETKRVYLSFEPGFTKAGPGRGTVGISATRAGPFEDYAIGVRNGDEIVYHQTLITVEAERWPEPSASLRPLPEPGVEPAL